MSGSTKDFSLAGAEKAAEQLGLVIVHPKYDELFVDIDDDEAWQTFERRILILKEHMPGIMYSWNPSKSGLPRRHVTVLLSRPVAHEFERMLLQALLGSDMTRELLGWIAIETGKNLKPTLFFEKKP